MSSHPAKLFALGVLLICGCCLLGCETAQRREASPTDIAINTETDTETADAAYSGDDLTAAQIKQMLLAAQSCLDGIAADCRSSVVPNKIIGKFSNSDVCACTGKYGTLAQVMDAVKPYYHAEAIVKCGLHQVGLMDIDGQIGVIEDLEDSHYFLNERSEIKLLRDEDQQKVVETLAYNADGEASKVDYWLGRQENGQWVVALAINVPEYNEAPKDTLTYYDDSLFTASASSELPDYPLAYLNDNNPKTTWTESVDGDGIGEWVQLESDATQKVDGIEIMNGYSKTQYLYNINTRIKTIRIDFPDGTSLEKRLKDNKLYAQKIKFDQPVLTKSIKITILDVYSGQQYEDACISELKAYQVAEPGTPVYAAANGEGIAYLSGDELTAFEHFFELKENNGFGLTDFSEPSEIDPDMVFYVGAGYPDTSDLSEAEEQDYLTALNWDFEGHTDITKLTTAQVNALLTKKAGIMYNDLKKGLTWTYLPEYETWYFMHGDTNQMKYACVSGYRTGNGFIILNLETGGYDGEKHFTVMLKETADGYQFVSNSNDYYD